MQGIFQQLTPYLEKAMALTTALTLIEWDMETTAPEEAADATSSIIGLLSDEYFKTIMNDEVKQLLHKIVETEEYKQLTEVEQAIVTQLQKQYDEFEPVPQSEYKAYSELTAKSSGIWAKAKENNDFNEFAETLKEIIYYRKKFATYRQKKGQPLYEVLLHDFEPSFTMEQIDSFFALIKKELVPLIRQITSKNVVIDRSFNHRSYDIDLQREFCIWLSGYVGFDFERGVISEAEHPFTTNLHNRDVRYTNHYEENNLFNAIFSAIHETGHCIYEMNIDDEITQTIVGSGTSMAMHESQSRFYENMIGKSKEFWEGIYEKLQQQFKPVLNDITLEQFYLAINQSEPSLIRTEADELTYPLHILIRYEIEKKIITEDIDVYELPTIWNDLYEEYLGIRPQTDAEGILQDVHWSMGEFGYFPSYALGSAIASQLYHFMKQTIPFEQCLKTGEFEEMEQMLKEHIHKYGMVRNTNRMLKDMTGETFNASYYIEYLKEKYRKIYDL